MSDAAAKTAAVDASMASVRRLEQLQSFEKVYAPFDGIVTARNIDIGGLIQAGENITPKETVPPCVHSKDPRIRRCSRGLFHFNQAR